MRVVAVGLLLCFVLAGCAEEPVAEETSTQDDEVAEAPEPVILRFHDGDSVVGDRWMNDTFPLSQCMLDCPIHSLDLTDLLDPAAPTQIHVEMTYSSDSPEDVSPGIQARIYVDGGRMLSYRSEWPDYYTQIIDATVLSADSVEVRVQAASNFNDPVGNPYSVHAETRTLVDQVPPGLPVRVHMTPNMTLVARTPDGDPAPVMMWSPSGAVSVFEGVREVDAPMEHDCILLVRDIAGARMTSDGSDSMEIVDVELTYHEAMEVAAIGGASKEYELPEPVAAVGTYIDAGQGVESSTWSLMFSSRLFDPDGEVVQDQTWCGGICGLSGSWYYRTDYGDWPAGTYTLETGSMGTYSGRLGMVSISWDTS